MRAFRFGLIVLVFASLYGAFLAVRLLEPAQLPSRSPERPPADARTVKADLCQLSAAEESYFKMTGSYATETELRSNGAASLPPLSRWPYVYLIKVPTPNVFTIVATSDSPTSGRPVAFVTDSHGQVCLVTFHPTRPTHQLDDPAPSWRDTAPTYECEQCPAGR